MEVLDRYLQSVSSLLPRGQRRDFVSELADDLRSEMDDSERSWAGPSRKTKWSRCCGAGEATQCG